MFKNRNLRKATFRIASELRREAREEWPKLFERRRGKVAPVQGVSMHGELDDSRILLRCFKDGEPATGCETILATGTKRDNSPHGVEYSWYFRVPKPTVPDATMFVVSVRVSSGIPTIGGVFGTFIID